MNMDEFYNAIEPIFNNLKHPILTFNFNEKTNEFISIDYYVKDDEEYTVVVRKNGSVVYGFVDGPAFNEVGILGKIRP